MAKMGGLASAKKRFEGLSKKEVGEKMRKVRYSKETIARFKGYGQEAVKSLNKND